MNILRTEKETFTKEEILKAIKDYQNGQGMVFDELYQYYKVNNPPIMTKKRQDVNNPDVRIPSGYGKKIVTTFTGYAWRPRYTTYKAEGFDDYEKQLQETFDLTNEHVKTSRIGKNVAIYRVAKEVLYIDGYKTGDAKVPTKAEPKISSVDPRNMVCYYNFDDEPKMVIAIKWDVISKTKHNVDVYYADKIESYVKTRDNEHIDDWKLSEPETFPNYFDDVPAIEYFMGEDDDGLILPVKHYIDALDALTSGSMNEFLRFADAYLRLVGMNLDDPIKGKSANKVMEVLRRLKKSRVFNGLKSKDDVTFLTKDIPAEYIKFISELIIDQIHIQSHVPDFAKFTDLSGIAVQRVMFDFENVCSAAEANIDIGLSHRIELINKIYEKLNREVVPISKITIAHKRNAPLNIKEFAETARTMKEAGFSRWLVADVMPDDIIPDVDEELARQDEDRELLMPNIYEETETDEI